MAGLNLKIDAKNLDSFVKAMDIFPKEAQYCLSRCLRDQAYSYKAYAVREIESHYTIRDKKFAEGKAWKVELPKASDSIDKQYASVSSLRIFSGGGLFTGWEEELAGSPSEMRKKSGKYHRKVYNNARDGSFSNTVNRKYRLRTESDRIPNDFGHFANGRQLTISQFLAMILKPDAAGRSKRAKKFKGKDYAMGKNKIFMLGFGGSTSSGYSKGLYTMENGKLKQLQKFDENPGPNTRGVIDWRQTAADKVNKKFTPGYIHNAYIKPLVDKIWSKITK